MDKKTRKISLSIKAREVDDLITDLQLIKLYEADGKRNLTFRCTYNAPDRTLTEEEVKPIQEKVEKMLAVQ